LGQTTLAPGAACVVSVQFRPAAAPADRSAPGRTVSVTDAAGYTDVDVDRNRQLKTVQLNPTLLARNLASSVVF